MTKVRVSGPSIRRAAPAAAPHHARRTIAAALDAPVPMWTAGRRYRPERRYMRGGRTHA